jgi:hypothetical protein
MSEPFRRRTAAALAAVGGTGLALMILYLVFGPRAAGSDPAAAALARSALGYRALVRLLETEVPVHPAHGVLPPSAAPDRPLLVLDPAGAQLARLADTVSRAAGQEVSVVVVLPKWAGLPDRRRRGWLESVELRAEEHPRAALGAAVGSDLDAPEEVRLEVVRPPETGRFRFHAGLAGGELALDLPRPQLFRDPAGYFEPLVDSPEGILVGRARDLPVYVVADPDLLNVAGIGRGDNAILVHRLLVGELAPSAWLVSAGSFGALPPLESVWRGLLRPPLSAVSAQLAAVALLLAWAAAERFGRPLRPPARVPPGKRTLVDNTARLLDAAGDPGDALRRYRDLVARRAAERLGLPPGLDGGERLDRLDRVGRRRGASRRLARWAAEADALPRERAARRRRAVEVAAELNRWYREVCDERA